MFVEFPDIAINLSNIPALCSRFFAKLTERFNPCCSVKFLATLTDVRETLKSKDNALMFLA
jgi:hypothetical protein